METKKGLLCFIYRSSPGDCSNSGISSKANKVVLMNMTECNVFEPSEGAPPVWIREIKIGDKTYYHAIPEDPDKTTKWWMHGGCYIETSDSRFPFDYPIPLHDRRE